MVKPGAALAAMRRIKWHKCAGPNCPVSFRGILTAKYCSNACRQKAKYLRGNK